MKNQDLVVNKFIWGFLILGVIAITSCAVVTKPSCISWEFNKDGDSEGWQAGENTTLEVENGNLTEKTTQTDDFWVDLNHLDIDATFYKSLEIRYLINSTDPSDIAYFYWAQTGDSQFSNNKRVKFNILTNNTWQDMSIDLSQIINWNGAITGLRLYPAWFSNTGASVKYDYIRLCK